MNTAIYTMDDWNRNGVFNAAPGTMIEEAIVEQFRDSMPPEYMSANCLQAGEPYDHDRKTGKPLYSTFERTENGWIFAGYQVSREETKLTVMEIKIGDFKAYISGKESKFQYMLLDRMRMDCKYYLGNGNRCAGYLWAGDPKLQIAYMKVIYDLLPEAPEWLTLEQINDFDKQMNRQNGLKA